MIHPNSELRWAGDHIGWGVFATAPIPRGTIVYVRDELEVEVSATQFETLHPLQARFVHRYGYRDGQGNWIVSIDNGRFVNHCCASNTLSTGYGFEVAVRDIEPGEQITDDYGLLNLDYAMECGCGSADCRGQIRPDDLAYHSERWDAICRQILPCLADVPQPLGELLPTATWEEINGFLAGDETAFRTVRDLAGDSLVALETLPQ